MPKALFFWFSEASNPTFGNTYEFIQASISHHPSLEFGIFLKIKE
jgi:hypothetical protein